MHNSSIVAALAKSFLAGEQTAEHVIARGHKLLGRRWRWMGPLARRYLMAFAGSRPRHRDVVRFLLSDHGFAEARWKYSRELSVKQWLAEPPPMRPAVAAERWNLPAIESVGALASWLHLDAGELEWFADLKGLNRSKTDLKLRHYYYRLLAKRSGSIRLIEAPKQKLKQLQRQILTEILNKIPSHHAVHGFIKGRSIKTFAAPHTGRQVVLRMDLQNFFPSFPAARIQTIFRTLGYPEAVADRLGGICTNAAPRDVWDRSGIETDPIQLRELRTLYGRPHLPQGAPTSPALANIGAYRVDCRLSGLALAAGAQYSRYADDLAFSGDEAFARRVERYSVHVAAILLEEGFTAHHRKTRIMRQGVRQHLAGLVVNQQANIARSEIDRLKAILTNCARSGPAAQNREAHPDFRAQLEGRISFVAMINPAKAARLRTIFDTIRWP